MNKAQQWAWTEAVEKAKTGTAVTLPPDVVLAMEFGAWPPQPDPANRPTTSALEKRWREACEANQKRRRVATAAK